MKQTLEDYIRQDEGLRKVLLKQDGGIMKYWAEHPDRDFDVDLFDDYEKQIAETYLRANKQNRAIHSLPSDKLREKSLEWYHNSKGSELKFLVALKPELNAIDTELYEQFLKEIDIYMVDAYKESRRRKYPEGIPPQVFYNEVIQQYGLYGLSLDCLERVLQEYRGKAVHIGVKHFFLTNIVHPGESPERKEVSNLQTEFDIRMFIDTYFADGSYKKLRQAVKEIIDNGTQNLTKEECYEECRKIAKTEMRKVHQFTRWVNNNSYPMEESEGGELVPLITSEERHWLRNIMYENSPGATGTQKLTTMGRYYCNFIHILQNIGIIWAAQLLLHGIDMKELEKETGDILSILPDFLYYTDSHPDDNRTDCCVYDWAEAKKLLAKVIYKTPYRQIPETHTTLGHTQSVAGEVPPTPKKKGRTKAPAFETFIKEDAPEGLMEVLEEMLDGKTGKSAFTIILAASEWLKEEPPIKSVCKKFNIGETAYQDARNRHYGLNSYIDKPIPIPELEISRIRENISTKLNERG